MSSKSASSELYNSKNMNNHDEHASSAPSAATGDCLSSVAF